MLTSDELVRAGLGPRYAVRIGPKQTVSLSAPYDLGSGRVAIVGYIPDGDRLVARSYYLSNSHGVWKHLPHYGTTRDGNINWFGKGFSQASISLPHYLQRAIATVQGLNPPLSAPEPERMFAGTARPSPGNYPNLNHTYVREVGFNAKPLAGQFAKPLAERTKRDPLLAPRSIRFDRSEDQPNYGRAIYSYQQPSSLYGTITIEVVPSNDAELLYHVARDERNRVWIASIENRSQITSTGLRTSYIEAGNLTTPAFDYDSESGGYGNRELRSGYYVDMFANYLSHVPVIQEFYRRRHLPLPRLKSPRPAAPPTPARTPATIPPPSPVAEPAANQPQDESEAKPGWYEAWLRSLPGGFVTAMGSRYTYDERGQTTRFKTIEGKAYPPQALAVFAKLTTPIEQAFLSAYQHDKLGGERNQKVYVVERMADNRPRIIRRPAQIQNPDRLYLAIQDQTTKRLLRAVPASLTPAVGLQVFETNHYRDPKDGQWYTDRHLGNEVTEILPR